MLDLAVAGGFFFLLGRDGVLVGRVQRARHVHAVAAAFVDQAVQQKVRAFAAAVLLNGAERINPLASFRGVKVTHGAHRFVSCVVAESRIGRCGRP
ncbi:hypothetical protein D3C71_1635840 [compost metagenome]